ncbi:MAG: flavoprotein [Acidimicrobiales bacterium]
MTNFDAVPLSHRSDEVLFLIVSAGRPALGTVERIVTEKQQGHQVRVIATPQAAQWLDRAEIERLTGYDLESAMLTPENSALSPVGNRVLATPVTLNTLTKWADGHSDNLAIGLLCEALGAGIPIVAELSLSPQFLRHPAVPGAVQRLKAAGVEFRSHPMSTVPIDWTVLDG